MRKLWREIPVSADDGAYQLSVLRGRIDPEIGPDEAMQVAEDTAKLIQVLEGEDVEKMDALLSLAITDGNFEWI